MIVLVVAIVGLVVVGIIALLAAIAIPSFLRARQRAQATMTLNNAHQIQMAAMRMGLDNDVAPSPALGWPGDLAQSPTAPVTSLVDYVERLVEYKYLERTALPKLFQAPGVPPYPVTTRFDAIYSPFKVYKVRAIDRDDCLFLATRNFTYGSGLDPAAQPYGTQAGVVCRKDGSAQILRAEQATSTGIGRLPAETGGVETAASVLKM